MTAADLAAAGYLRHGQARASLTLRLTLRNARMRGSLQLSDTTARVTLTLARYLRIRTTAHGLHIDGVGQMNHPKRRTLALTVETEARPHTKVVTVTITIPALRYRLRGPFHGRLTQHVTRGRAVPARELHKKPLPRKAPPKKQGSQGKKTPVHCSQACR